MEVSLRYTPVAGRLHTRYAPVRRSPAVHCCAPLPLDLHVLSLPLAFILSQDQTLHCMNCFALPKLVRCLTSRGSRGLSDTRCLPIPKFQCPRSRFRTPSQGAVFSSKAGAKIQPIFNPTNIFFLFSGKFFRPCCASACCKRRFFSSAAGTGTQNGVSGAVPRRFSGVGRRGFSVFLRIIL